MYELSILGLYLAGVGFMVARGAQSNPFVFAELKRTMDLYRKNDRTKEILSKDDVSRASIVEELLGNNSTLLPTMTLSEVMKDYSRVCMKFDMPFQNAKYVLCQMSPARASKLHEQVCADLNIEYFHGVVSQMKGYPQLAQLFGLVDYYNEVLKSRDNSVKQDTGDYTNDYKYVPDGVVLPVFVRNEKRKAIMIEA